MSDIPHEHFWYDLNSGKSINASEGSAYHIQHVIRNPSKFGFNNKQEMQQHARYGIKHIESGRRDVDPDLEHHVMAKGFARGYSGFSGSSGGSWPSYIHFDVSDHDNLSKALEHFLPHLENEEARGKEVSVEASVGHKGRHYPPEYFSFSSTADIKRHIGSPQVSAAPPKKEPSTPPAGFGLVSSTQRGKEVKRRVETGKPRFVAQAETDRARGSWGDSVEYKSFKDFFSEQLNAAAELRKSQSKSVKKRLSAAGGEGVIRGTVAQAAGLSSSQLSQLEKKANTGKSIPNKQAQIIAQSILK